MILYQVTIVCELLDVGQDQNKVMQNQLVQTEMSLQIYTQSTRAINNFIVPYNEDYNDLCRGPKSITVKRKTSSNPYLLHYNHYLN